jgi:aspartyl/asparaginyl beta-hydroxylase (cupin superfamily)
MQQQTGDPGALGDPRALAASGIQALRAGDPARARDLIGQALAIAPKDPPLWVNLALAHRALGETEQELAALERALAIDPRGLYPLLLKGAAWERRGDLRKAGEAYSAALAVAPPFEQLPQDLRPAIRRAVEVSRQQAEQREAFLREHLAKALGADALGGRSRFRQSVEVMLGKKSVYRQQPHVFYFPGLPCEQFYDDRSLFPWLPEVEAATDVIREEMLAVLEADEGLTPYIQYADGLPIDQWAELNHDLRWSAFHFGYEGKPNEANQARCPRTMNALEPVDQAQIPGLSPAALYSILKPRTRIPPHTGVTNARLLCHIPLVVPENCLYRVGNDEREWQVGHGLVFDDTIEHEARNDSDKVRVMLIFDLWHPALSQEERHQVAALFQGLCDFQKGEGFGE